ncbi:MAG: NUDIX domain-containing protein [Gemmatimonadales bacterium]
MIFRCTPDGPMFLLIKDGYKNWGFPKGHIAEGETPEDAARREIIEETSLDDLILHEPLGVIDWYFRFRGKLIHKYCHFFLFESGTGSAEPQTEEGISACSWYSFTDAVETISYENALGILRKAGTGVSERWTGVSLGR